MSSEELSKEIAEKIAVQLNIVFNNAALFGPHHPSTKVGIDNLVGLVNDQELSEISFLKNGQSLYIEEWIVDHRVKLERLISQFTKCQLESVTLCSGVVASEVESFVQHFNTAVSETYSIETISNGLAEDGVNNLLVNYITLQQVKSDEKIVGSELVLTNSAGDDVFSGDAYDTHQEDVEVRPRVKTSTDELFLGGDEVDQQEIDSRTIVPTSVNPNNDLFDFDSGFSAQKPSRDAIVSISDLLSDGASAVDKLAGGNESGTWGLPNVKEQFKALGIEVEQGKLNSGEEIDYDELFNSLSNLSSSLKQGSDLADRMKSIEDSGDVLSEVEQLTFDTIVQIVRREFEQGKPSVEKLAFMLRRVAPSAEELRKLLPKLKQQLINDGYSVGDFLNLTIELEQELSSDHALDGLFKEAADFGVDRDELIGTIMENPGETSRLLLQAAEIQKRVGEGYAVSGFLEKMIEDMTSNAVMDQLSDESEDNIHSALTNIVTSFEDNVLAKMRSEDSSNEFVEDLSKRLKDKFPDTIEKIKSEWMVNKLASSTTSSMDSSNFLVDAIAQIAEDSQELDYYKTKAAKHGESFGYSEDEVENILKRTKQQEELRKRRSELHILSYKSTIFFIKRYIAEFQRYDHPFSLVMFSSRKDSSKDLIFVDQISLYITDSFRNLDIIGQLSVKKVSRPLLILPMTNSHGLTCLKERFRSIPNAGEYIISAIAIDSTHRNTNFEKIMKKLLKKHVIKDSQNSGSEEEK